MRYLWQKTYPRWFCCLSSKQLKWKDKWVQEGKYQVHHKEPKRQKRLSKGYLYLSLFGRCSDYGTCHFPRLICFLEFIPHINQSAFLLCLILFEKDLSWPDFLDPVLSFVRWPLLPYDKVFLKKTQTLKFIYIFVHRDPWSLKQLLNV